MMTFNKIVQFTDIHLGLKGNSQEHNKMCLEFADWMIAEANSFGADTCVFLGDFFHQRNSINVLTFDYGIRLIEKLSQNFKEVIMIVGNHDLFYRASRSVHSVEFAKRYPNVHVVDNIETRGDCLFVPFMVQDEYKTLNLKNIRYAFGHFELPGYMLNNMIEMPDHGKESESMFSSCEYVFSGHFHKRQVKKLQSGAEIHYIGNTFPHNFSDSWDHKRGIALLEYAKTPVYKNWDNCPKYRDGSLSNILRDPNSYCGYRVTLKASLDVDISIEDINFIREQLRKQYKMTDFIVRGSNSSFIDDIDEEYEIQSVDHVVNDQINKLETTLDKQFLIEMYNSL